MFDREAIKMGTTRRRLKISMLHLFLAIGFFLASSEAEKLKHHGPMGRWFSSELRSVGLEPEMGLKKCSPADCAGIRENFATKLVKREAQGEDVTEAPTETPDDASTTAPGLADSSGASSDSTSGSIPLPPIEQEFPNMPTKFPYPGVEPVQSPPLPTASRKKPGLGSVGQYPGAAEPESTIPTMPSVPSMPTLSNRRKQANETKVTLPKPLGKDDDYNLADYQVDGPAAVNPGSEPESAPPAHASVPDAKGDAAVGPAQLPEPKPVPEAQPESEPKPEPKHEPKPTPKPKCEMHPEDWRYTQTLRPKCGLKKCSAAGRALEAERHGGGQGRAAGAVDPWAEAARAETAHAATPAKMRDEAEASSAHGIYSTGVLLLASVIYCIM